MPLITRNGQLLRKSTQLAASQTCCCGGGDCTNGGFCYVGNGGSTCWSDVGNAHIAKITNNPELLEIDGLGVIGATSVSISAVEQAITYSGQSISPLGLLSTNVFSFPVSSQNPISLSSVGSRNTGEANNWSHPVGVTEDTTNCGITKVPASTGGQGAYFLSVSKYRGSSPAFMCTVCIGCQARVAAAWDGTRLGPRPTGTGTYYYVLVDNQNTGTTLNGTPAATCGSGPMIEHGSRQGTNFDTGPNWVAYGDCVALLVEAWVLPL